MSSAFAKVLRDDALAYGGMKNATLENREIVVCKGDGGVHAIARRCGHMNAPLEMGTLNGTIVTCPMHCAQFDILTGETLCGPAQGEPHRAPPTLQGQNRARNFELMVREIRTEPLAVYEAKVEDGWILVRLGQNA